MTWRLWRRSALCVALAVGATPRVATSQQQHGWFIELGGGWAAILDESEAWNGGESLQAAAGFVLRPSLAARLSFTLDDLAYDLGRRTDLFPADSAKDSGLSGRMVAVAGDLEWTARGLGVFRPAASVGLTYVHRSVDIFPTSLEWYRCVRAVGGGVPAPTAECSELREDIDIDGGGLGLTGSAGLNLILGRAELGLHFGLVKAVIGNPAGVLQAQIRFRRYF